METTSRRYRDHRIELVPSTDASLTASAADLLIDGARIEYGQFVDGTYYLAEDAYEWGDDLLTLAERLIDSREGVTTAPSTGSER